ncbi:MAG: DUF86 domain-containing protein [Candidatus Symbiobacter sp.]|nr:DUF86 domain-containing protein [Candidatus Symbiobacter sp.]
MKPHNDQIRLSQMIDFAEKSQNFAKGRTREDFENDAMFRYALIYIIQTLGEAASKISRETRDSNQQIPWRNMTATRNILVHEFDGIDNDVVWQVIADKIPELLVQLKQVKLNAE